MPQSNTRVSDPNILIFHSKILLFDYKTRIFDLKIQVANSTRSMSVVRWSVVRVPSDHWSVVRLSGEQTIDLHTPNPQEAL